jgi:hypothetical protein
VVAIALARTTIDDRGALLAILKNPFYAGVYAYAVHTAKLNGVDPQAYSTSRPE